MNPEQQARLDLIIGLVNATPHGQVLVDATQKNPVRVSFGTHTGQSHYSINKKDNIIYLQSDLPDAELVPVLTRALSEHDQAYQARCPSDRDLTGAPVANPGIRLHEIPQPATPRVKPAAPGR